MTIDVSNLHSSTARAWPAEADRAACTLVLGNPYWRALTKKRPNKTTQRSARSKPTFPPEDARGERLGTAEVWHQLRQGARNIAGVTYQVAITADLLVAGVANRPGFPAVRSVLPEGWEDVDLVIDTGTRIFVQVKERSPKSGRLGPSALADVIVHAARGIAAAGELAARIVVVTDATLAQGIRVTGWGACVAESIASEERTRLETLVGTRLRAAGIGPELSRDLISRTSVVRCAWNASAETQRDLVSAYGVHPAVAWLAYTALTERLARLAAKQRGASVETAEAFTATDLRALVEHVASAVDVDSLEEAVAAGVCGAVDFLTSSDLTHADFFRGVSAAPAHIAADLDTERSIELRTILDGLNDRRSVLIAGPSGSGKSTLLWRAARLLTLRARVVRVYRVASEEDIVLLARHVRRNQPSELAPLVVCADNVGAPAMSLWSEALPRILEIPSVYVLSTVRREDYLPSLALDGVVVDSTLDAESAAAIYAAMAAASVPTVMELEEATERAGGLLMEFIALVTTGTRLRDVLASQLERLRSDKRSMDRTALRLVCAVHSLGFAIDASDLSRHLSLTDPAALGDALSRLEGEHLVVHDLALGEWRGIHDLRVEIIQELLHQSPPPTLADTMCEALTLVAPASQPHAIVRAAELLARHAQSGDAPCAPGLDRLVSTLRPLASRASALFESPADPAVQTATRWTGLLEAAIRLDAIAYAYATFPLAQAACPSSLDPAGFAGLLYSIRVDGLDITALGQAVDVRRHARAMPEFDTRLSETLARGASPAGLVRIAGRSGIAAAAGVLEAAETLIELEPEQARQLWSDVVPSLPNPAGAGFDGEGADLRARVAAALVSLAGLTGRSIAIALGPTQARADDAIASDPDAAGVSLRLTPHDPKADQDLPIMPRPQTWSAQELLVAETSLLYRADSTPATAYAPVPNEGDGMNRRVVGLCRRLLDACPEVDRADISAVGADWEPIHYDSMVFGSKAIRASVLRVGPTVRRNVAYQAVIGRMSTANSWSARLRLQAGLAHELQDLLGQLLRRIRAYDNERRAREWKARLAVAEGRASALPRRPGAHSDLAEQSLAASDESSRAKDPEQQTFAAVIGGLTAAMEGVESGDRTRFNHAAHELARARLDLLEARRRGVPKFAAVADPLPPELDDLTERTERLLNACGIGGSALERLTTANSDSALFAEVDALAEEQEVSDRSLIATWMDDCGLRDTCTRTISDPDATPPRLNPTRTLTFVPAELWNRCVEALMAAPETTWEQSTGGFVVLPVDHSQVLPIGVTSIGLGGSWMPVVDYNDFAKIAAQAGFPVLTGRNTTTFREVATNLLKWSEAVELRARRPSKWIPAPMPSPQPASIRDKLKDDLAPESATDARRELVEALIKLADTVAAEDGSCNGLAANLVHAVANPSNTPVSDKLSELAVAALEADLDEAGLSAR